jgi:dihydropteroate synthase
VTSIAVDPGIGFSYANLRDPSDRIAAQSRYLLYGGQLRQLGFPVLQSLPHAFAIFQEHYRSAEGYFAVLALLGGAGVLRVHEVGQVRAVAAALRIETGIETGIEAGEDV